jgi:hypothetical protein
MVAFESYYRDGVAFSYATSFESGDTAEAAANRIESWAFWYAREVVEVVNDLRRGFDGGEEN